MVLSAAVRVHDVRGARVVRQAVEAGGAVHQRVVGNELAQVSVVRRGGVTFVPLAWGGGGGEIKGGGGWG